MAMADAIVRVGYQGGMVDPALMAAYAAEVSAWVAVLKMFARPADPVTWVPPWKEGGSKRVMGLSPEAARERAEMLRLARERAERARNAQALRDMQPVKPVRFQWDEQGCNVKVPCDGVSRRWKCGAMTLASALTRLKVAERIPKPGFEDDWMDAIRAKDWDALDTIPSMIITRERDLCPACVARATTRPGQVMVTPEPDHYRRDYQPKGRAVLPLMPIHKRGDRTTSDQSDPERAGALRRSYRSRVRNSRPPEARVTGRGKK